MKTCKANCCNAKVFSHDYCRLHQWMRTDEKYKIQKEHAKLNRRTPKREKEERRYADQAKEFFEESDKKCVFCGKEVQRMEGLHHWKGRTNDYLLDKRWWSVVHNFCHVDMYHHSPKDKFKAFLGAEYENFLTRLKKIDLSLWEKETNKDKKLHPTILS